ncbi:MAG TPA: tRNA preQ1(34) S-adenosylmethionine ribosyltransferase-isomerase QueA [Desulfomonilia bacterium]
MKLSDFHYDLSEGLIAQYPLPRGTERLMIVDRAKSKISHGHINDFKDYLLPDDTLVLNNSKVIPARLTGKKATGGNVEIFLLKELERGMWECLVRSSKPSRPGTAVYFESGLRAEIVERELEKGIVRFDRPELIFKTGKMPLPPYISRDAENRDREYYQTVYAKDDGSVAAPTAGLHFTNEMLTDISRKGIEQVYITLHVGLGTFKPVRVENIENHIMHEEEYFIGIEESKKINMAMNNKTRIVSVGTTTTRVLEHLMCEKGRIESGRGSTGIFIRPGFEFRCVNALLTNFHLPCSTLIMLVCAFGGYDLIMKAYSEAVKERYRFFSYGDAMLII